MKEFFEFKEGDLVRFIYGIDGGEIGVFAGAGDRAIVSDVTDDGFLRLSFKNSGRLIDVDPRMVMHDKQFEKLARKTVSGFLNSKSKFL
jgi:hypothetical protein